VTHERARTRLPDLLADRDEPELLAHVAACHDCQRQLFLLGRVDRALRGAASGRSSGRRRVRKLRWPRLPSGLAAAAVAAAVVLMLLTPHENGLAQLTLRTASGQTIGHAVLDRSDAESTSLTLVARGLPGHQGDTYVLWASGSRGRPTSVGRFMVDPGGACRARFNLPGGRTWARFWVTTPGQPNAVVAST
jgi:Anti-sigma-K factor rskA